MHADENMFANRKLCIGIIGKNGQIMRARNTDGREDKELGGKKGERGGRDR